MFEKVNPMHPDKIADRIAGALVDYAYTQQKDPRIAVEVLIGHGVCTIIAETSVKIPKDFVKKTVYRISERRPLVRYQEVPQDAILSKNQTGRIRCGDNGIFKGTPVTNEQRQLSKIARQIYSDYYSDGKYILHNEKLVICQSNAKAERISKKYPRAIINPLGYWTGGTDVDSGATNRKLGSDMGDSITGGGLHGKDLSKADVSVNIHAFCEAQIMGEPVELCCAIGDESIGGIPYEEIVEEAREYIRNVGGFEKFAEWGLI